VSGGDWCNGAQAAYNLLQCQGVKSYGPPYSPGRIDNFHRCESCLQSTWEKLGSQGSCLDCLHKVFFGSEKP